MTKTIKGFIKTFNKHELGKEYSKTNSYLADGILFELKDVYNAGTNDSVIYPYIYEVEAKIEDVWNISKGQTWLPDYFQTTKAVAVREVSYLELVQAIDLTSSTKEKFEKIYNGDLTKEEFETTWASLTKRSFEALGHNQRFLYIACLSQDKYELTKPEKELSETTLMLHAKYGKLFNKDLRVSSKVKMNIATEFKAIREVEFSELVNVFQLTTRTKNEINSILNGTAELSKVVSLYKRIFQKSKWDLSKAEQFKLLAILNQNHYELPTINITWCYQIPYVKILKFFNKPYSTNNNDSSVLHKIKREELYGSKDFETGIELPMKELICHINLKQYIETRKLTQEQFEAYCEYMFTEERTIYYNSHAIAAGYKILQKYKRHFYPYLIYSDPEMALELLNKRNLTRTEVNYFYEKNYKIGDYNFSSDKVKETKSIFVKNEDYKYIEVAT